jgi:hypothetical protein
VTIQLDGARTTMVFSISMTSQSGTTVLDTFR